jgi:hypothetical protein
MTSTSSLDGQFRRVAHRPSAVEAPYIRSGRPLLGTHQIDAATEQSPRPTIDRPTPKAPASGGVPFNLDVHTPVDAQGCCDVEAPNIRDGQSTFDTHLVHVVSEQSPRPTIDRPTPIDDPPGGVPFNLDVQRRSAIHPRRDVGAPNIRSGHPLPDAHRSGATTEQSPRPTMSYLMPCGVAPGGVQISLDVQGRLANAHVEHDVEALYIRGDHRSRDTQASPVAVEQSPRPTSSCTTPTGPMSGGVQISDGQATPDTHLTGAVALPYGATT